MTAVLGAMSAGWVDPAAGMLEQDKVRYAANATYSSQRLPMRYKPK